MYTLSGRAHIQGIGTKTDDSDENGFFTINIEATNDAEAENKALKIMQKKVKETEATVEASLWERRLIMNF